VKVVHLSSAHPAHDVRILYKECKTLAAAGYDVTLVALNDQEETVDGVRIVGLPKPKNRLDRMVRNVWRVARAALRERADVYHFHDPELIPVGLLLRLAGKRVVYDVHECVPHAVLTKDYLPPVVRQVVAKAAGLFEFVASRFLHGIVAATPAIAERFPARQTITVQNFPLLQEFTSAAETPYSEREPIIAYVGTMTRIRGVREMVDAIGRVPAEHGARLALAGSIDPPDLETEAKRIAGWERVEFSGWCGRQGVVELLGRVRVGLVVFHPAPNHVNAQPNKLFEYMAAGIPVVASDFPRWRGMVEEAGCGLLVDPLRPERIAEAITWLLDHPDEAEAMGQRGRKAARDRFNWGRECDKMLCFYREMLGDNRG